AVHYVDPGRFFLHLEEGRAGLVRDRSNRGQARERGRLMLSETRLPESLWPLVVASKEAQGELTIEVAPENIVEACRRLKNDLHFERLSTVTGVDRYPAEPRFEVVYHLHSVSRNE